MINDPERYGWECAIKTVDMVSEQGSSGFPPVIAGRPRALILGSLPGRKSLEAGEYYAQSRNSFWPIMGQLFDAGRELAYRERLRRLTTHAVALWDVLASARRPGSLDSKIDRSSIVVNDFGRFLDAHETIRLICFNGRTAAALYERYVLPDLTGAAREIERRILPSTSPAHAALSYAGKLERWSHALADLQTRRVRASD